MSQCATETSQGLSVANPVAATATAVAVPAGTYNIITVFNETDQLIKVIYTNAAMKTANFLVPKNGRAFTREIKGNLSNTSLKVQAIGADATGLVVINIGN